MSKIEVFGTLFDASIDGTNLSSKDFYCYDVQKPLLPRQKKTSVDIPGRPGLIHVDKKFISDELILKGFVECDNYSDLKTKLKALSLFLFSEEDTPIILSNENDRYWNAQYNDYKIIGERDNYSLVDLIFDCDDPFAYNLTPDDEDNTITTNHDLITITNNGDTYAFPVITLTFNQDQTNIYIENNNIPDNRIDITRDMTTIDTLEIDCKNRTVKFNDVLD